MDGHGPRHGVGAGGRAVVRLFGGKLGLPVFAFASGFVSSLATIAAMSDRARHSPSQLRGAAGGAILSTVATILQLAIILAITSRPTLAALAIPLVCAGVVATGYGAAFTLAGMRGTAGETETMGAAFSLRSTLVLGGILAGISFSVAVLKGFFGEAGAVVATAIAGIADTHAPAVSIATLVASGRLAPAGGVAPILAGLTTNTLSKVAAAVGGGRAFALCVVPGLVVIALAAWAGALFGPMLHIAWSGKP